MYDHGKSTSYVRQFMLKGHQKLPRQGYIASGSGQAVTEEGNDTVRVGGRKVKNFPLSEILQDSLAVLHKKGGAEGVFGLQHMKDRTRGESFFSMCRDRGLMTTFGYCRGKNDTGTFLWGDNATDGKAIPVKGKIHWAIDLSRVEIAMYSGTAGAHSGRYNSSHAKHHIHHPSKYRDVLKHGSSSKMPVLGQDGVRALLSQKDNLAEFVRAKYSGDVAVLADGTDADEVPGTGRSVSPPPPRRSTPRRLRARRAWTGCRRQAKSSRMSVYSTTARLRSQTASSSATRVSAQPSSTPARTLSLGR
jgi:hypothetical protein